MESSKTLTYPVVFLFTTSAPDGIRGAIKVSTTLKATSRMVGHFAGKLLFTNCGVACIDSQPVGYDADVSGWMQTSTPLQSSTPLF